MSNVDKEGAGNDLVSLAEANCNDTLGSDGLQQLEQLLLSDPEARQAFRRYLGLDAALRDYGDSAVAGWLASLPKPAASLTERVDVDAVLRDSLGESRDNVTVQVSSDDKRNAQRRATMLKRMSVVGVCAVGIGLAVVFGLSGNNTVLAQVQNAIKKANSVSFTVTRTVGDNPTAKWKVKLLGESLCCCEQENGIFTVLDKQAKKVMEVDPAQSKARIAENLPVTDDFNILAKLTNPNSIAVKGASVKAREFNDRKATGFIIEENGVRYNVWVDPATNLPLEMERAKAESKEDRLEIQEKWTEFRFDEPMDKSLFVFEAPKGFAVETHVAPNGDIATSALEEERRQMEKAKASMSSSLSR